MANNLGRRHVLWRRAKNSWTSLHLCRHAKNSWTSPHFVATCQKFLDVGKFCGNVPKILGRRHILWRRAKNSWTSPHFVATWQIILDVATFVPTCQKFLDDAANISFLVFAVTCKLTSVDKKGIWNVIIHPEGLKSKNFIKHL